MSLQPTSGILALVIKMDEQDPEAAREFVRLGLYEALVDQIEANRPALECDALRLIEKQASRARSRLLREYVGKALEGQRPADVSAIATGLAVLDEYVAKADLFGATLALFERQHKRGEGGRFTRMDVGVKTKVATPEQTADAQSSAEFEVSDRLKALKEQHLVKPEDTVLLHYGQKPGDSRKELQPIPVRLADVGAKIKEVKARAGDLFLTGVSVAPEKAGQPAPQRAAFNALHTFAGTSPMLAQRVATETKPRTGEEWDETNANWNNETSDTDRRSYRRMAMTGQALQRLSEPGATMDTIGGLASLIGSIGPEAEKVLTPGFQRVAYRYRGTERRPDAQIMNQMKAVNTDLAIIDPEHPSPKRMELAEVQRKTRSREAANSVGDPAVGVLGYYLEGRPFRQLNQDQRAMRVRGDIVAADLVRKLPDPRLSRLNMKAGQTPPSQGVIIDSDGRVVTQAQGFNGDHYLPFDLKNLKSLHGGQYVRTRVSGGPTTEDIYTGLLAGARQMQVVSNSGVFTVELDPDLRGGRRYSDKAAKMVERYGRILDAVGNSGEMRQDLSPDEKTQIRQDAYENVGWDEEAGKKEYHERLQQARVRRGGGMEPGGQETSRAKLDRDVAAEMTRVGGEKMTAGQRGETEDQVRREFRLKAQESAVKPYQLDGPGYHDALRALQAEFPYFIRSVKYEEMPEFYDSRGLGRPPDTASAYATDRAYVAPGLNRASREEKAYHGAEAKASRGKYKAGDKTKAAPVPGTEDSAAPSTGATGALRTPALGTGPVTTGGGTVKLAGVTVPLDRYTVPLTSLIGPGKPATRHLAITAEPIMTTVGRLPIGTVTPDLEGTELGGDKDKQATTWPLAYTKYKWGQMPDQGRATAFADWLVGEASEDERSAVASSLVDLPRFIRSAEARLDATQQADVFTQMGGASTVENISMVANLIALKDPFAPAKASEDEMVLADPTVGATKPQPWPAIVKMGATMENYDKFKANAGREGKTKFLQLAAVYAGKDDKVVAREISDAIAVHKEKVADPRNRGYDDETGRLREIKEMQQAWAFARAERLARAAKAGKFDPKAWAPPAAPAPVTPAAPPEAGTAHKSLSRRSRLWPVVEVAKVDSHQAQAYLDRYSGQRA